jgi:hypothetical protein
VPGVRREVGHDVSSVITKATPAPGLGHRRATAAVVDGWTPRQLEVYRCGYCLTPYRPGSGANWVCEHWHERAHEKSSP